MIRSDDLSMPDPVLERALRAVGQTRAHGLHFYGHFIGVTGDVPSPAVARLTLDGEPPGVGSAAVSPVAVATLVDLAMSAAVRSLVDPGARLGTVTLSFQHLTPDVVGPLAAAATAEIVTDGSGMARCSTTADGRPVAETHGWFAVLPAPPGKILSLTPWERGNLPAVATPTLDDLDDRERAVVAAARRAAAIADRRGTAVSREMLSFAWRATAPERSAGTYRIGPEVSNRVGHMQGGALYGAAAVAAAEALGDNEMMLADGYYQFLRPADGSLLQAEGTVVRRGRRAAFVEARLAVDGTAVGLGLFSFRR